MSVWCSTLILDDDEEDQQAPLVYQQSHVLPSMDGERGGELHLGAIPAFITRDGRDDGAEVGRCWPYLRVSLRSPVLGEDTIVLDLAQVDALIAELQEWRGRVDEGRG